MLSVGGPPTCVEHFLVRTPRACIDLAIAKSAAVHIQVHGTAVKSMDAWEVSSPALDGGEKITGVDTCAGANMGEPGTGGPTVVAEECLVVSGALDRTLCVFRARFGQGLSLLRKLNVACSPRGLPGALIVGIPAERAYGGVEGTQLEVSLEAVWVVGAHVSGIGTTTTWYQVRLH